MKKIIETVHLTKRFGLFTAVNDVSITVGKGEIYGFLGLNGAGKTTTICMLLGLIRPSGGSAYLCGEAIRPGGKGPWNRVGSLVEVPFSYPELSVRDNLELVRRMRGIADGKAVDVISEQLQLKDYLDRKAGHLSLGNAQRLGLAKALMHRPDVLILDEPSNGLDPAGIVEIRTLLNDLAKRGGVTIFVSSHILDEVARLATRIGIIHQGRMLKEMDTAQIHTLRRKRLLVGTRDNRRAVEQLKAGGFTVATTEEMNVVLTDTHAVERPDDIASLLVAAGNPPTVLCEKESDLETVFMEIISEQRGGDE